MTSTIHIEYRFILGCIDTFSRDTARCKKISCPVGESDNHHQ